MKFTSDVMYFKIHASRIKCGVTPVFSLNWTQLMNEYQLLLGTKTLNDLIYCKTHASRITVSLVHNSCVLSQLTQLMNE